MLNAAWLLKGEVELLAFGLYVALPGRVWVWDSEPGANAKAKSPKKHPLLNSRGVGLGSRSRSLLAYFERTRQGQIPDPEAIRLGPAKKHVLL